MSILETLDFQPMLVTDVFESVKPAGKWFNLAKANRHGSPVSPYVARSGESNGISALLPPQAYDAPNPGNAITIGVSTSTVFYQPVDFYTGKEIQVLRHQRLTSSSALVLVTLLREQMMNFQWGNGASLDRLRATHIMVPVLTNTKGEDVVDWDGMDRLGTELLNQVVTLTHSARATRLADDNTLPELRFEPMFITDVFDSMTASKAWYDKVHLADGPAQNLYLSQTLNGNSVSAIVADQGKAPEAGNCITVTLKTQSTFYQPAPFYTAQNFLIFRHKDLDDNSGLFLVTAMRRAMEKFSWGYGVSMSRLQATRIMVPVVANAEGGDVVDWDGMSAYGHALRVRAERAIAPIIGDPS